MSLLGELKLGRYIIELSDTMVLGMSGLGVKRSMSSYRSLEMARGLLHLPAASPHKMLKGLDGSSQPWVAARLHGFIPID